jgi:hypothetical protein
LIVKLPKKMPKPLPTGGLRLVLSNNNSQRYGLQENSSKQKAEILHIKTTAFFARQSDVGATISHQDGVCLQL